MFDIEQQDLNLLTAYKERYGLKNRDTFHGESQRTGVLEDARFICDNAVNVSISRHGTEAAATMIWNMMQNKSYSPKSWSMHTLHPKPTGRESTVNFIFTMDLLNYCFWSELGPNERFAIEYQGQKFTGYWSLVAALQRALEEGIPMTSPSFWYDEEQCTDDLLRHVFRSATEEEIPLFVERAHCLREAGAILCENYNGSFCSCISDSKHSATALVNLLASSFPCFRDETIFEGRRVRLLKRAQILVADIWACFEGEGYGEFRDIHEITMFADYRIPQMLYTLGCLLYSPPLETKIRRQQLLAPGEPCEVELRGCSIWAVELLLRFIKQQHPEAEINAILIDFFLYDTIKERESASAEAEMIPHHRTRGIWY